MLKVSGTLTLLIPPAFHHIQTNYGLAPLFFKRQEEGHIVCTLDSGAPASEARTNVPASIKPDALEIKIRYPPTTGEVVAEDAMDNVVAHIEL